MERVRNFTEDEFLLLFYPKFSLFFQLFGSLVAGPFSRAAQGRGKDNTYAVIRGVVILDLIPSR